MRDFISSKQVKKRQIEKSVVFGNVFWIHK